MGKNRPNIVFGFADDWGRYASAYVEYQDEGTVNELIDTPNFDRVASEGALFLNAYVPAPSCTPCRSSILSGKYFWETGLGAILQGAVWDENIPTYPLILEESGYHIGYSYKVWRPGSNINAPYGGDRTKYESHGENFNRFSHFVTGNQNAMGKEGAKQYLLNETRNNFKSFLEDRPGDDPFCFWWGPTNTHRTWQRGSGKALWGINPDDLKGRMPEFFPDVHDVREDFADYLGECMAVDAGLGEIIQCLEEIGELDNTVIVVSGDHGIPGMPRSKTTLYDNGCEVSLAVRWPGQIPSGRIVEDFVNLMDLAPTFLDVADVKGAENMSGHSLLKVLKSDKNGVVDKQRDFVVTGRERHVAAAREGYLPYPTRAIRTDKYLYIRNYAPDRWPMGDPRGLDDPDTEPPIFERLCYSTSVAYSEIDAGPTKAWMVHHRSDENVKDIYNLSFGKRPEEELYDVTTDPDSMDNLAGISEYDEIRIHLKERLTAIQVDNHDPRETENPCRFEFSPYADPVAKEYLPKL